MLRGNVNYIEEIEELKHQINMLKLDVGQPEIIQPSACSISLLNQPYEQRTQPTEEPYYENWLAQTECWNCDKREHLSRNCRSRRSNNNNTNSNWVLIIKGTEIIIETIINDAIIIIIEETITNYLRIKMWSEIAFFDI